MLVVWCIAVLVAIESFRAISLLVSPAAINASTSISRLVSDPREPVATAAVGARTAMRWSPTRPGVAETRWPVAGASDEVCDTPVGVELEGEQTADFETAVVRPAEMR